MQKSVNLKEKNGALLINDFFSTSKHIQLTIHLIDSRHKPTELDIKLNDMLRSLDIPYIVLLNKSDKLKQSEFSSCKETNYRNISRAYS